MSFSDITGEKDLILLLLIKCKFIQTAEVHQTQKANKNKGRISHSSKLYDSNQKPLNRKFHPSLTTAIRKRKSFMKMLLKLQDKILQLL